MPEFTSTMQDLNLPLLAPPYKGGEEFAKVSHDFFRNWSY